jgi:hypothetical protein
MKSNEEHCKTPGQCPCCDSVDVDWYGFDVVDTPNSGSEAHQEANCMICDFAWDDVYTLTGFVYTKDLGPFNMMQTPEATALFNTPKCTITGKPEPDDDHDIYEMMAKRAREGTPDPQGKSDLFTKHVEGELAVLNIRLSKQPDWDALLEFIETMKAGLSEEK